MSKALFSLTRRERQIMDILYRRGRATAADVMGDLSGEPNYSTVRTQLRVLEEKGHVRHEEEGLRYVYSPAVPRHAARKSALRHLVNTFFDGSTEKVVGALLGGEAARLSDEELDRIGELVAKARRDGKPRKDGEKKDGEKKDDDKKGDEKKAGESRRHREVAKDEPGKEGER